MYLNEHNYLEPDILWIQPNSEKCYLVDGKYWHGSPDLIIEILSAGTEVRDRRDKFHLYEQHAVAEYWIVDPHEEYIEVYQLQNNILNRQGVFGVDQSFDSAVLGQLINVEKTFRS